MNANLVKTVRFAGRLARESLKLGWRVAAILLGVAAAGLQQSQTRLEPHDGRENEAEPDKGEVLWQEPKHNGAYGYWADADNNPLQ